MKAVFEFSETQYSRTLLTRNGLQKLHLNLISFYNYLNVMSLFCKIEPFKKRHELIILIILSHLQCMTIVLIKART